MRYLHYLIGGIIDRTFFQTRSRIFSDSFCFSGQMWGQVFHLIEAIRNESMLSLRQLGMIRSLPGKGNARQVPQRPWALCRQQNRPSSVGDYKNAVQNTGRCANRSNSCSMPPRHCLGTLSLPHTHRRTVAVVHQHSSALFWTHKALLHIPFSFAVATRWVSSECVTTLQKK